jgi:hypothetical protein
LLVFAISFSSSFACYALLNGNVDVVGDRVQVDVLSVT